MTTDSIDRKEFYDAIQKITDENKTDRHESNNKMQEMILRLEEKLDAYLKTIGPIEIKQALHEEKISNLSKNVEKLGQDIGLLQGFQNSVNVKIAGVCGAWAVIIFFIQFIISKWL